MVQVDGSHFPILSFRESKLLPSTALLWPHGLILSARQDLSLRLTPFPGCRSGKRDPEAHSPCLRAHICGEVAHLTSAHTQQENLVTNLPAKIAGTFKLPPNRSPAPPLSYFCGRRDGFLVDKWQFSQKQRSKTVILLHFSVRYLLHMTFWFICSPEGKSI